MLFMLELHRKRDKNNTPSIIHRIFHANTKARDNSGHWIWLVYATCFMIIGTDKLFHHLWREAQWMSSERPTTHTFKQWPVCTGVKLGIVKATKSSNFKR